jgi:pimeloyl-ACP methyl ester carboxylesterase
MATFVLLPGAGSTSWYWHLVEPELRARGHDTLAVDLPVGDERAGLGDYAEAAVTAVERAVPDRDDLVVVAQSMGAFTAPVLATRVPTRMIVLVAPMTPAPGESPGEWWANTGHEQARREAQDAVDTQDTEDTEDTEDAGGAPADDWHPATMFLHDVPPDVAAQSAEHVVEQAGRPFADPWPLEAWPDVPTRVLLCRQDRLFPASFQRRLAVERLGITPDEMDGGHLPALARPVELAARLSAYAAEV